MLANWMFFKTQQLNSMMTYAQQAGINFFAMEVRAVTEFGYQIVCALISYLL